MFRRQGCGNQRLLLLLVSILVYSLSAFCYYLGFLGEKFSRLWQALLVASLLGTHWIITETYIVVAQELKWMVNIAVHADDPKTMEEIRTFRRRTFFVNAAVITLILVDSVLWFIVGSDNGALFLVAFYFAYVMGGSMLLAWAWLLTRLYN